MVENAPTNDICPYDNRDFKPPRDKWVVFEGKKWHPLCANMIKQGEPYR